MRPESLKLTNYRSYAAATIDLSAVRLGAISGDMGAGKSTIMEAIVFALTGAKGSGALDARIRDDEEECNVTLVFSVAKGRYKVSRTRSRRSNGKTTAELVRDEGGAWVPECTGADAVDARIEDLLGADEKLLLQTSFIGQEDAKRFLELQPSKRLESFTQILALDEQYGPVERYWKGKADEAKAALDDARREVVRLEADVATLAGREADRDAAQAEWTTEHARLVEAERALTCAREAARAAEQDAVQAEGAKERLSDLRAQQANLRLRKQTLAGQVATFAERIAAKAGLEAELAGRGPLQSELAILEEAERADALLNQERAVRSTAVEAAKTAITLTVNQGKPKAGELERLTAAADGLNDRVCAIRGAEIPTCDRCGQSIANEALARTLEQLESELEAATDSRREVQEEVEALRAKLAEQKETLREQEESLAAIPLNSGNYARVLQIQNALDKLNEIPAKLAEIASLEERGDQALSDMQDVQRELEDPAFLEALVAAERAADAAEGKIDARWTAQNAEQQAEADAKAYLQRTAEIERTIARHEEAIAMLSASRAKLTETQAAAKLLEEDQADADLLRKAFSKWGIPSLIVGNVLLALDREVNELLAFFEEDLSIHFEGTKETRDGARDSLEILVTRRGFTRTYENFSGGQKFCVASCVRLGLALLRAHRSGARVETLMLDEPDGLDAAARQNLVAILRHLSDQFALILLMSHHEDLKDALPSQIHVTVDESGLSQVEVIG